MSIGYEVTLTNLGGSKTADLPINGGLTASGAISQPIPLASVIQSSVLGDDNLAPLNSPSGRSVPFCEISSLSFSPESWFSLRGCWASCWNIYFWLLAEPLAQHLEFRDQDLGEGPFLWSCQSVFNWLIKVNNLCEVITSTQLNNMSMLSMPSMHKHENYI